jgi:chromate transporter
MKAEMNAPTLPELTRTFAGIGCLSFGGPAAQIALMHRVILDEKKWVGEADYLRALSFCMLLPGPEAMQLATWIGWRLHGVTGGLIAGGLFVLPGAVVVLALSIIYAALATCRWSPRFSPGCRPPSSPS